ncbi:MAG: 50S ribosomal protein L19e [Candidatus Micrarchaeia archaeon]
MTIGTVRRLAADIFGVGENKVKINPDGLKDAEGALTRADVRGLIEKGIVTKVKPQGRASTGRTGRTGHGRRRGTPVDSKGVWMDKVRSQRRLLQALVSGGALKKDEKRALYYKIKSGIFRNKRAMVLYLKDNKLVPADFEMPKKQFTAKPQKPATQKKAPAAKKPETKKEEPKKHEANPHAKQPEHQAKKGENR